MYRRTLLSRPPKQIVSSGRSAFTSLFGMGRGGARFGETPVNKNSGVFLSGENTFCPEVSSGMILLRENEAKSNQFFKVEVSGGLLVFLG